MHAAAEGGLDYLIYGTVFASGSKPGKVPAGVAALAEVVRAVALPVLAVGGVTPDNLREVAMSGAAGFAAIGVFAAGTEASLRETLAHATASFSKARV
jgi:thiamine monophosphate synthase